MENVVSNEVMYEVIRLALSVIEYLVDQDLKPTDECLTDIIVNLKNVMMDSWVLGDLIEESDEMTEDDMCFYCMNIQPSLVKTLFNYCCMFCGMETVNKVIAKHEKKREN